MGILLLKNSEQNIIKVFTNVSYIYTKPLYHCTVGSNIDLRIKNKNTLQFKELKQKKILNVKVLFYII